MKQLTALVYKIGTQDDEYPSGSILKCGLLKYAKIAVASYGGQSYTNEMPFKWEHTGITFNTNTLPNLENGNVLVLTLEQPITICVS